MGEVGRAPPGSPQYLKTLTSNVRYEPYPKRKSRTKKTHASQPSEANKENIDADPKPKARAPKPKKTPTLNCNTPTGATSSSTKQWARSPATTTLPLCAASSRSSSLTKASFHAATAK
ncbi:MAG: hypothetical protein Q9228_003818 [Teloschistes exilis]